MIYGGFVLWVVILAKGRGDKPAHQKVFSLSVLTQAHPQIAFIVSKCGQEASVCVFEALDSSHIADKILPLVALDRSPFLIREVFNIVDGSHPFLTNLEVLKNAPNLGRFFNLSVLFEKLEGEINLV